MASPAPKATQEVQTIPLQMVGGTKFGRYPKISNEATWNFIVSDGWLVPYAGYANALNLAVTLVGRGIYSSYVGGFMVACIGSIVAKVTVSPVNGKLTYEDIGNLATSVGDIYIAENNNQEICLTDGVNVYVYNYATGASPAFQQLSAMQFPFDNPGYISFQGGQLIIAIGESTNWVLSAFNDATTWSTAANSVGSIQTKPDFCQAVAPIPGGGNNILVFGRNVIEQWQRVGTALFPFQRTPTFNVDFGCLNPASIAHLKNYIVWLAVNEQSGPVIMLYMGGQVESISTDGIDYQLGNLTNPENCTGFLFQQDGHVLYQFTFPDDNISYAYDFETKMFFNVSDENLNYHIAREVVYFNNNYYFVALNQGNVFEFSTLITAAQYDTSGQDVRIIPRIRICPPLRLPDQLYYVARSLGFTIESGQPNTPTTFTQYAYGQVLLAAENGTIIAAENGIELAIDLATVANTYDYTSETISLAVSRNGGQSYGTFWSQPMNQTGNFYSRFIYQRLGHANDSTYQLRFNGFGRFICTDGIVEIYQ
jgi:hypothetical protein